MDTLADLASMQHHQPPRSTTIQRNRQSYERQLSPSTMYNTVHRTDISHRSSFDLPMAEKPKPTPRTDFTNTSLPTELQQQAGQLASHLLENPHHYQTHFHFIKLLHQGYRNHLYPPSLPPGSQGNPRKFDLLKDLRMAREAMDRHFAIGEDLWADWLQDESMLAQTLEERTIIMDKCQRAVEEENGSVRLWTIYGEWMLYCYEFYHGSQQANGDSTEEEKLAGMEIFSKDLHMNVWKEAVEQTQWRMNDSHLVWNRYIDLINKDLAENPTPENVRHVKSLFDKRLQIPHKEWENTFQMYSTFITAHLNDSYERIMVSTSKKSVDAKSKWDEREILELSLSKAQEAGDTNDEYQALVKYIEFERGLFSKQRGSFECKDAIYSRAELKFPSISDIWVDHALFVIDQSLRDFKYKPLVLPLLDRATRHCPWSGTLWAQYLLTAEKRRLPYEEIQKIKNKATTTGLLEEAGMEEVLKVEMEWCNYLRRRAFRDDSTNDDLDIAEIGIRSAIENLQDIGRKVYGPDYHGDPKNRLEYIYVKYLSQSRSWDTAREVFKGLIQTRGERSDFWTRYYLWEMMTWSKFSSDDETVKKTPTPHHATAVLQQAMKRPKLDAPERIMQAYLTHCEDHEEPEELQRAIIEVRKKGRLVAKQKQHDAEEAAAVAAAESPYQNGILPIGKVKQGYSHHEIAHLPATMDNFTYAGKRKRNDEGSDEEPSSKRPEPTSPAFMPSESSPAERALKRDRENATILVQNLPKSIPETRIRQFFRDCGTINSLKVLRESDSSSATVEFEDKDSALAAQTRDGKDFEDHELRIQLGSGSTIFVANYPPTADESHMRSLFSRFGDIVDIRFPSLKFDTHRRFCYIQFKHVSQAKAAVNALDGNIVGEEGLKLQVKISNPLEKKDRTGATAEGRELFVRNVHWDSSEQDIKALFSAHGTVESVRLPRNINGKSKGFCYVTFSSASEAQTAIVALNGTNYLSRTLTIEIANAKKIAKRQTNTIISRVDRSVSADPSTGAPSPSAASTNSANSQAPLSADKKARTVALLNVPDTVNEPRIRVLAEKFGPLIKLSLRPDHQGAILEFVEAADAGKASMKLEGYEITDGRKLGVGSVQDLLKMKGEKRHDKIIVGQKKKELQMQGLMPIRRPGGNGMFGAKGKRGGLGFKASGRASDGSGDSEMHDISNGESQKKTQDDFRKMLSGGR